MSIQKQKLQGLAHRIYKNLLTLNEISKLKKNYAQKINYKMSSLFSLISQYPSISVKELKKILDPLSIKLLIQNKKYFTVEDLCNYLRVSNKHANNCRPVGPHALLQVDARYQLEQIINKEVECMESIRQALKSLPSQQIFSQIDFFNNGYIDSDSLLEFVSLFNKQNQNIKVVQQQKVDNKYLLLRCLQVIRYLKGSATAQKIFQQDFITIFEDTAKQQKINPNNPQNSRNNYLPNNSLSLSRSIGQIVRVSQTQVIQSIRKNKNFNHHVIEQSHLINFISMNGSRAFKPQMENDSVNSSTSKVKVYKIIKKKCDTQNYEQRICENHWRNAKYLQKIKLQSNFSNFRPTKLKPTKQTLKARQIKIQSQSQIEMIKAKQKFQKSFFPLKQQQQQVNCSQILYQLRYLSQIYDRHKKQVESFINQNQSFSIINGFNVIDVQDRGYVSYKELKQFLFQIQIALNEKKIFSFFKILSKKNHTPQSGNSSVLNIQDQVIYYHSFATKIFKIKQLQNLFNKCRKRKPLVFQQWPQQQKRNYCRFIRNIVTIFFDISNAKKILVKMLKLESNAKQQELVLTQKVINKMQLRIEQIFKQNEIHYEKFKQILGKNSQTLIGQLYGTEVLLQAQMFLNFLEVI